jgi:hypothetical protein
MPSDWFSLSLLAVCCLAVVLGADRAEAAEGELLAPKLKWWDEWRARTKEPVPDFGAMKSWADLPPLLRLDDGRPVRSPADWDARQAEIRRLLCHWIIGTFPDRVPPLAKAEIVSEETPPHARRRIVRLAYRTATTTADQPSPRRAHRAFARIPGLHLSGRRHRRPD